VDYLSSFKAAMDICKADSLKIILWEKRGESLKEILKQSRPKRTYALVGPEGGLTEEEVTLAREHGFIPTKLGQRILRTETAAITLIGILQYELGDL
jgi:16S rRNA (uracil1498-N3)-methyltransferase